MPQRKKCFVIMPVSKTKSCTATQWTTIFNEMIKPAVLGARLGFTCERSNPCTGSLIRDILNELNKADVVVADLTDTNPNVFYELGVRHTLRNRTILIAQDMKFVPSDLRSYWVIVYRKGLSGLRDFRNKIREVLREMMRNPENPDNPVADFLGEKNISLLSQEKSANLKKLTALVSELSYNLRSIDSILSVVQKSKAAQKQGKPYGVSNVRFSSVCLNELLSTRYVELPMESTKSLMDLNELYSLYNMELELWRIEQFHDVAESKLHKNLPKFKDIVSYHFKRLDRVRLEYMNNNYQEEVTPCLVLASEQHAEYIKST
ncbi:hypothetical protein ACFLW7_02090 [Chloroflexota bacterium]